MKPSPKKNPPKIKMPETISQYFIPVIVTLKKLAIIIPNPNPTSMEPKMQNKTFKNFVMLDIVSEPKASVTISYTEHIKHYVLGKAFVTKFLAPNGLKIWTKSLLYLFSPR